VTSNNNLKEGFGISSRHGVYRRSRWLLKLIFLMSVGRDYLVKQCSDINEYQIVRCCVLKLYYLLSPILDISHDAFAHQESIGCRRMACTSRESRVLLSTSRRLFNGFEKKDPFGLCRRQSSTQPPGWNGSIYLSIEAVCVENNETLQLVARAIA